MNSEFRNGEDLLITGLKSDEKPTTCPNGTRYIEMDNSREYRFDEENKTWHPTVQTQMLEKIHNIETYTDIMANGWDVHDFGAFKLLMDEGLAEHEYPIGSQLPCAWNNGSQEYDFPWDIVDYRNVVNANGNTVRAAILQAHWCLPGLQFDASEAAFVATEALPAGKYNIGIGTNWGTHCVKDKAYDFDTTEEIPAGGQIVVTRSGTNQYAWGAPDQDPSTWVVYTFASASATTPLEGPLPLTEGSSGTSLGALNSAQKYSDSGLNNLQRAAYGYNRWKHSAARQWLNSDAAAGSWWAPQNPFDRPPQQLASVRGFKAGLPADFLAVVEPIVVPTALNTVSDPDIGTSETTLDTFFLPSLEEEYIVPQLADVEGPYWPYWKERLELNSPQIWYGDGTNAKHIRYLVSSHSSAQYVRLRAANRGHANGAWSVHSAGTVNDYAATYAHALAPACAICASE